MNFNNIKDITDVFNFYKTGKVSQRSMEGEISRAVSGLLPISVIIDKGTSVNTTNSSYLAAIVPELINGQFKITLVLDDSMLTNKLTAEELQVLLGLLKNHVQQSVKELNKFINEHRNTEVSYLECLSVYLKMYLNFILDNEHNEIVKKLTSEKTIDREALSNALLAIESGNETQEKVVEYTLINKLLPEFALQRAEDLFKRINVGECVSSETTDLDTTGKPVSNYWYATIASKITGTFNPETHTELDPFYIPKSNLNR